MTKTMTVLLAVAIGLSAGSGYAQSGFVGDPVFGEQEFLQCTTCHSAVEGEHKRGPSLFGVIGRDIASVEGFNYSTDLQALGGTWNSGLLSAWLVKPRALAKNTKMDFSGIRSRQEIENIVAYLATLK
ncbi:MAG: c-type cytochrome [Pseudomonadota bacterium]